MGREQASPDLRRDGPESLIHGNWLGGEGLYRVGFAIEALPLIQLLSGLVDIHLTLFDQRDNALVFIVQSNDVTGTLFRHGMLVATPVQMYRDVGQGLLVHSLATKSISSLSN